jgi:hypothetical protein
MKQVAGLEIGKDLFGAGAATDDRSVEWHGDRDFGWRLDLAQRQIASLPAVYNGAGRVSRVADFGARWPAVRISQLCSLVIILILEALHFFPKNPGNRFQSGEIGVYGHPVGYSEDHPAVALGLSHRFACSLDEFLLRMNVYQEILGDPTPEG